MSNTIKITVIVLNWNGWKDTLRCLESLMAVKEPDFNVLVVDNGSEDESVTKIHEFIETNSLTTNYQLLTTNSNLGFAGGNNVGIKSAYKQGAEYILILNNDTVVDPSFLDEMLEIMEANPTIGLLNPKIYLMEQGQKTNKFWFGGADINWLHTRGTHRYFGQKDIGQIDGKDFQETDYCTGGALLVRRKTLQDIHLLPSDYFLYYEDTEWSLHARKAGWRCAVAPKAHIWHQYASSTGKNTVRYVQYHVRNGLLLCLRTAPFPRILVAYCLSIPKTMWHGLKWVFIPKARPFSAGVIKGTIAAWLHNVGKIKH